MSAWLFCAAALCGSPAAAADWDSVAGWDVYEIDAKRCVVGRVFAAGPTTFGIIMSVDGETRVFATRAGWTTRAGAAVPARIALDGRPLAAGASVGIEQRENRGFVVAAPADFLDRFAVAKQLAVSASGDQAPVQVQLTGSAAGLAQGRRCLANLREEARMRSPAVAGPAAGTMSVSGVRRTATASSLVRATGEGRAVASPALPRRPRSSWVTAEDYPDAALRAEEQGSVTVKLAIDRSGEVAGCDIVRSSGSLALDSATCRTVTRRARYRPATDGAGRPVDAVDNHTVRWSLPR